MEGPATRFSEFILTMMLRLRCCAQRPYSGCGSAALGDPWLNLFDCDSVALCLGGFSLWFTVPMRVQPRTSEPLHEPRPFTIDDSQTGPLKEHVLRFGPFVCPTHSSASRLEVCATHAFVAAAEDRTGGSAPKLLRPGTGRAPPDYSSPCWCPCWVVAGRLA